MFNSSINYLHFDYVTSFTETPHNPTGDPDIKYDSLWLFEYYANHFKKSYDYFYTTEGITFLVPSPRRPDYALWLYRIVAPFLLLVGTCGNVLSAIVMMSI